MELLKINTKARENGNFPCIGPGKSLERNRKWGTKIISSFLPTFPGFRIGFVNFETLGRPRKILSSPVPRLGRRTELNPSKPVRKPAILGFGELFLTVPFFQEIAAFVLVLIEIVHFGAQLSNLELFEYESPENRWKMGTVKIVPKKGFPTNDLIQKKWAFVLI